MPVSLEILNFTTLSSFVTVTVSAFQFTTVSEALHGHFNYF